MARTRPKLAENVRRRLREAFADNRLTLYLGAGVSVGNGLPSWQSLVLAMYFTAIREEHMQGWRPFPNYLFAIAEWHLGRTQEPLDITARKLRKFYQGKGPGALRNSLHKTLYAGFALPDGSGFQPISGRNLRFANSTLEAVTTLCEKSEFGRKGVRAVVTENYDSLLEIALNGRSIQPVWKSEALQGAGLPIYHVHGYVPLKGGGSAEEEIVFTEEQYHLAAQNAYSWSNLVQIQCMSSTVGLMIGLSLTDRNMRRLLDAVMNTPVRSENYALIREPQWGHPRDDELNGIHQKAMEYYDRFERSGVKGSGIKGSGIKGDEQRNEEILGIIEQVERLDRDQQTFVLKQLGVEPVWYKDHADIPAIIDEILDR